MLMATSQDPPCCGNGAGNHLAMAHGSPACLAKHSASDRNSELYMGGGKAVVENPSMMMGGGGVVVEPPIHGG